MIFAPSLCERVLSGEKTVTRRRLLHRGGRPIQYRAGRTYAVQPGRGKKHVGHVTVLSVNEQPLGWLGQLPEEWKAEGFASSEAFYRYWTVLHGAFDYREIVARIEFALAPWCGECPVSVTSGPPTVFESALGQANKRHA